MKTAEKLAAALAVWLLTGFIPCAFGQALLERRVGQDDRVPWPLHNSSMSGGILLAACAAQIAVLAGAVFVNRGWSALATAALVVSAAVAAVEIQITMP